MVYRHATYEEYYQASKYAKVRYRFGVFIQLVSMILLIYLLYYTITNIEEMKANPKEYAEEKLGVICFNPILQLEKQDGITRYIEYAEEW